MMRHDTPHVEITSAPLERKKEREAIEDRVQISTGDGPL
jgi:hypothetical protein